MRSRINAVVMLAASFIVFATVSSANGVQTSGRQFPTAVLMDGPGPMCIPDAPCVYDSGILASRARFRPGVLMADGTGPMCIPHTACGYKHDVVKGRDLPAAILLTDGTGPMCIPGTACMSQLYLPRAV
jgi:hypothetical protein